MVGRTGFDIVNKGADTALDTDIHKLGQINGLRSQLQNELGP